MANDEHVMKLLEGIETWNAWREVNPLVIPDLRDASLAGANLVGANLHNANLDGASLNRAILDGANLDHAKLRGGNLRGASLNSARLSSANLAGASLNGARLDGAKLDGASLDRAVLDSARLYRAVLDGVDLYRTNLESARLDRASLDGTILDLARFNRTILYRTVFADVNLSKAKGLEKCRHDGPSIIDHHTLARSRPLPLAFLRGCGLSDWEIEVAKLHQKRLTDQEVTDIGYRIIHLNTGDAIRYDSCFISYAHTDESCAQVIHEALQNAGVRCWFAPEDLKIGARLQPRIDEAIYAHRKLLLVLSASSMKSTWVKDEVEIALARERDEGSDILFPISLDKSVWESPIDWADRIRKTRHIGDFTQWQNEEGFQQGFDRLLRDLRGEPDVTN